MRTLSFKSHFFFLVAVVAALSSLVVAPARAAVSISGVDPDPICLGQDLAVLGSFGTAPSRYAVQIRPAGGGSPLHSWGVRAVTWSASRLTLHVGASAVAPGTYQLSVDTFGESGYATHSVQVSDCSAPPPPPTHANISATGVNPNPACLGEQLTVLGSFGAEVTNYSIQMAPSAGGPAAHTWNRGAISWSASQLRFMLGASDVRAGTYDLTVDTGGEAGTAIVRNVPVQDCGSSTSPTTVMAVDTVNLEAPIAHVPELELISAQRIDGSGHPAVGSTMQFKYRIKSHGPGSIHFRPGAQVDAQTIRGDAVSIANGQTVEPVMEIPVPAGRGVLTVIPFIGHTGSRGANLFQALYKDANQRDNSLRPMQFVRDPGASRYRVNVSVDDVVVYSSCDDLDDGQNWRMDLWVRLPSQEDSRTKKIFNHVPVSRRQQGPQLSLVTDADQPIEVTVHIIDFDPLKTNEKLTMIDNVPANVGFTLQPSQWHTGVTRTYDPAPVYAPGGRSIYSCKPRTVGFKVHVKATPDSPVRVRRP